MKIDMHVHTNVSSPCSFIDPERGIARARELGLDAICVTEHDEIKGAETAFELGKKHGVPVFRGIEIYTEYGDMLVYGLYRDLPAWQTPFEELVSQCAEVGAVIIPAHFCRITGELERCYGIERIGYVLEKAAAIETHNGGCTGESNQAALVLSKAYGLPGTGGSDAHHEFQIGRCLTVFDDVITTDVELVAALKAGRYRGEYGAH